MRVLVKLQIVSEGWGGAGSVLCSERLRVCISHYYYHRDRFTLSYNLANPFRVVEQRVELRAAESIVTITVTATGFL